MGNVISKMVSLVLQETIADSQNLSHANTINASYNLPLLQFVY